MGIFDFIQKGAQELFIARPDSAKKCLVWKWPDQTIPMKAQLTVMGDECAFFYRDGVCVGRIDPTGHRVTLESSNIPFLGQLVDKFTGGNIFKAELWFVTTREVLGYKFGGKSGPVQDPQSGLPMMFKIHGDFSMKVTDPDKLIKVWGTRGEADDDSFEGFFREQILKVFKDRIGEMAVKKNWPLMTISSGAYTEEIEEEILLGVKKHLDDYGLTVVRMGNFDIQLDDTEIPESMKKLYGDAAYVRMAGGMQGFQQFAAGKAMMGAGEGMAKGGGDGGGGNPMLGGAGMGIGLGMAQMFQQQGQQQQQHQQQYPQQQQQNPQAPTGAAQVTCPACNKMVAGGKFCAECGGTLAPAKVFCANCGQSNPPGSKFCAGCGTKSA